MDTNAETIWTVSRIAGHLGVQPHRVVYIIDSRGIKPIGTAGIARVFDAAAVAQISHEIARIDAERGRAVIIDG